MKAPQRFRLIIVAALLVVYTQFFPARLSPELELQHAWHLSNQAISALSGSNADKPGYFVRTLAGLALVSRDGKTGKAFDGAPNGAVEFDYAALETSAENVTLVDRRGTSHSIAKAGMPLILGGTVFLLSDSGSSVEILEPARSIDLSFSANSIICSLAPWKGHGYFVGLVDGTLIVLDEKGRQSVVRGYSSVDLLLAAAVDSRSDKLYVLGGSKEAKLVALQLKQDGNGVSCTMLWSTFVDRPSRDLPSLSLLLEGECIAIGELGRTTYISATDGRTLPIEGEGSIISIGIPAQRIIASLALRDHSYFVDCFRTDGRRVAEIPVRGEGIDLCQCDENSFLVSGSEGVDSYAFSVR